MVPFFGTPSGIQDRSPTTTSVGHLGHGGACAAISLQATMTAAGHHCQTKRPSGRSTRCSRASSSSIARGVVKRDPSASRASIASSGLANETSPRDELGPLAGDGRLDVQGGIEQDGALDAVGVARRELRDQLAAEAVTDPGRAGDPERVCGVDEVGDVLLDAPRWLPASSGHARGSRRRPRENRASRSSASARKRRPWPVTPCRQITGSPSAGPPLRDAQLHESTSLPKCDPLSSSSSAAGCLGERAHRVDHGPPRSRARTPPAGRRSRPGCPSSSRAATVAAK